MGSKPIKASMFEGIGSFFGIVRDVVVPAITASMKQNFEHAMDRVEQRLRELQAQLLRTLAVWVLVFIAILSLALGAAFIVVDMLGAARGYGFLVFSGVLALCALLLHLSRPRYRS